VEADGTTMSTTNVPTAPIAPVHVPGGTLSDDWRAVRVVWKRELIRFSRNRIRIATSLAQPLLFLLVLGTGLSHLIGKGTGGDFRTFMFPGVLAMTVLFTAIFSAVSVVWDREFGFLREMLVAPARRGAIIMGKAAGGATVATTQAVIMLIFAGLVHVPYSPSLIATLLVEMALTAFMLTAFGLMLASRIEQVESFQVVIQFFVLPTFFLSGAVFPLSGIPPWLEGLTKIDPLSYAVDPLRRAVFAHVSGLSAATRQALNPGMTWNGWRLPTAFELGVVLVLGAAMLSFAIFRFSKTE
jgi:ABC-2 type transport system permease protein